jgi:ATP-dependent protease Clp ATPase subunit
MIAIGIVFPHQVAIVGDDEDVRSQCSFCGRLVSVIEHLISSPESSICTACVRVAVQVLRRHNVAGWRPWWRFWGGEIAKTNVSRFMHQAGPTRCSFCKLNLADVSALLVHDRANICSTCVKLCTSILGEGVKGTATAVPEEV